MINKGNEYIWKNNINSETGRMKLVIDDVKIGEDGVLYYRPAPYQTYWTEEQMRKEFIRIYPLTVKNVIRVTLYDRVIFKIYDIGMDMLGGWQW